MKDLGAQINGQTPEPSAPETNVFLQAFGAEEVHEDWQDQAYAELRQRDTTAEMRWRLAERRNWLLTCGLLVMTGVASALFLAKDRIYPVVQVVQQEGDGQVHFVGGPIPLSQYTPTERQWRNMLALWIHFFRWRGEDPRKARADWNWIKLHTCGSATAVVAAVEKQDRPYAITPKKVVVQDIHVAKAGAPQTFTVVWDETVTDGVQQPEKKRWSGTFWVDRVPPQSLKANSHNDLGLCVAAFHVPDPGQ